VAALAIEVNDVALVALRAGSSHPLPPSPGLALLDGGRLLVGAGAAEQARLKPRFVHDGYWDHLDTAAAGVPFPDGMRRADLAHAHLVAIAEAAGPRITEAYLAVPGFWSTAALGLLLGVARAAGLPVVGLVDAAVAAGSLGHEGETLLHVDLTRHRSVVTAMAHGGGEVTRTGVTAAEGHGWTAFEDAWASAIAGQFVRETRFDPRHAAASEQALHDALPGWLGELCLRQALPAQLEAGGRAHTLELTRASLLAAAAALYRGLAEQVARVHREGEPATILLTHRAALLPGMADRLRERRGLTIVELHASAAAGGALRHADRLRHAGEALPFVTRLPSGATAAEPAAPGVASGAPSVDAVRPTHVVVDGVAHRIDARGLALGTAPPAEARGVVLRGDTAGISRHHCTLRESAGQAVVEDHSSEGTFVNGARVRGESALRVGDRLRLGPGRELLLVGLEE
jgi:FHA domain-containing protein